MSYTWEIELRSRWLEWYPLNYRGGKLTGRWKETDSYLYVEVEKERVVEKYLGFVKVTETARFWYREDEIRCARIFDCKENNNESTRS